MDAGQSAPKRRKIRDKERAAQMKRDGVERRTGICPLCYGVISNDTFGGDGAKRHLIRCQGRRR